MAVAQQNYSEPKMLVCPECAKKGSFEPMRIYRVINLGVELEWQNGMAVMRIPGGDALPLISMFGEIEGCEVDRDQIDGDLAECLQCGYEASLDDVLDDETLYTSELEDDPPSGSQDLDQEVAWTADGDPVELR